MHCASLFGASWDFPVQVNICYNLPDGQVVEKVNFDHGYFIMQKIKFALALVSPQLLLLSYLHFSVIGIVSVMVDFLNCSSGGDEHRSVKIGVLAIQGAFAEHVVSLKNAAKDLNALQEEIVNVEAVEIRNLELINNVLDGLIIPGGESTVMQRYLKENGYLENLIAWTRLESKFTWGTCAGLILLSNKVIGYDTTIGGLDVTCMRNAFGRQVHSFETTLSISDSKLKSIANSDQCHGIFIRAPQIKSIDSDRVSVLSTLVTKVDNECCDAVGVCQNNIMATTFHAELTSDLSWHKYFIKQVIFRKYSC